MIMIMIMIGERRINILRIHLLWMSEWVMLVLVLLYGVLNGKWEVMVRSFTVPSVKRRL